jgi:hypothetical protein
MVVSLIVVRKQRRFQRLVPKQRYPSFANDRQNFPSGCKALVEPTPPGSLGSPSLKLNDFREKTGRSRKLHKEP